MDYLALKVIFIEALQIYLYFVFYEDNIISCSSELRERSGSVVECLTRDRGAAGSSLTALWCLSKTHLSKLSTGSTKEDPSLIN